MQSDLQKRIFANVLLVSEPEHVLMPRRSRLSISTLVSLTLASSAVLGLVALLVAKLQAIPIP